jgi:hypothetical protein
MPTLEQHCSNGGMPCFVNDFGTFRRIWDQAEKNPGALVRYAMDMFSNITYHEIQRPSWLIAGKICHVGHFRCTYDWHNHCSGWKLIQSTPPPITLVHLAVESTTNRVRVAHQFKIKVCLKWEMCQKEHDKFGNIPVL